MRILKTKRLKNPIEYKSGDTWRVRWSKDDGTIGRDSLGGRTLCKQEGILEQDHKINFAQIVQLDKEEAKQLELANALGVIEGEK